MSCWFQECFIVVLCQCCLFVPPQSRWCRSASVFLLLLLVERGWVNSAVFGHSWFIVGRSGCCLCSIQLAMDSVCLLKVWRVLQNKVGSSKLNSSLHCCGFTVTSRGRLSHFNYFDFTLTWWWTALWTLSSCFTTFFYLWVMISELILLLSSEIIVKLRMFVWKPKSENKVYQHGHCCLFFNFYMLKYFKTNLLFKRLLILWRVSQNEYLIS